MATAIFQNSRICRCTKVDLVEVIAWTFFYQSKTKNETHIRVRKIKPRGRTLSAMVFVHKHFPKDISGDEWW